MQSYGFTESAGTGRWAYQMPFCSQKMTTNCSGKPATDPNHGSQIGLDRANHARMDGHTDNYGEDSYNEGFH